MQDNFVIELRNKTHFSVSERQADVIDQALQDKAPVHIGKSTINSVDIVGIWDEKTWYENHPEDKPEPVRQQVPGLMTAVDRSKPSIWRDCVKKNSDLLKKGLLPKYTVLNGTITEKEYYWR